MNPCVSARTESELLSFPSYQSNPNGGHVKGLPPPAAAHTANPYSVYNIKEKVLLQSKGDLCCSVGAVAHSATFCTCPLCMEREGGFTNPITHRRNWAIKMK